MAMLDKLYYDLQTYQPEISHVQTTAHAAQGSGSFARLFSKIRTVFPSKDVVFNRPKSLYIYGGAGCGKVDDT